MTKLARLYVTKPPKDLKKLSSKTLPYWKHWKKTERLQALVECEIFYLSQKIAGVEAIREAVEEAVAGGSSTPGRLEKGQLSKRSENL